MGFVMPHITILIAGGAVGLALLFQIIGLATPGWVVNGLGHAGLWRSCARGGCFPVGVPAFMKACRAFGILGVLAMAGSLACAALICFMSEVKVFSLVAIAAAASGAFCALIEFAVYAGEFSAYSNYFGYSFALTVVAFVLCGVASVLFFLGRSRGTAQ
ncbi:hypothetical protein ACOMHN_047233 [Nucella lapillus]